MYQQVVTTQAEAIAHLFFHCCFRDGAFNDAEIKTISDKLVLVGLHKNLNFKNEVIKYQGYRAELRDETDYLQYLTWLIRPTNELAVFSYCVELCLSDAILGTTEETLLANLAAVLNMEEAEREAIKRLMLQRSIVETQKLF